MKKRLFLGVAFASILALTACGKDNTPTTIKTLPLYDYNDTYTLKNSNLDTYYLNDSLVPYVSVSGYINSMDGTLNASTYSYSPNTLFQEYVVKTTSNGVSLSVIFDYKNDKILTAYPYAFQSTVDIKSTIDYSFNLKTETGDAYNGTTIIYDLASYGFDMKYINGNCLVPFQIMNALFGGNNYLTTYYTGQSYYQTYFSLAYSSDAANKLSTIMSDTASTLNNQELRESNYNFLCFYLDHFYGLKEHKGIRSFDSYLDDSIKTNLKSTDPKTYMKGYVGLVQKLNELHTSIHNYTITEKMDKYSLTEGEFLASNFKKHNDTATTLRDAAKTQYGEELKNKIEIDGDTCYIFFRNFETGATANVKDSSGNLKEDAYLYDSYYLFYKAFEQIKASSTTIKNIVVDLSINGGGNAGALFRTLGFLAKKITVGNRNSETGTAFNINYKSDTNMDGKWDDNDSYPNYNWYVLTSLYSYSSANLFAHLAKQSNEKVMLIGEAAGGGGCSILPMALIDGTVLQISGTGQNATLTRNGTGYSYTVLEEGHAVDYAISYDKYYDRTYLTSYLNTLR